MTNKLKYYINNKHNYKHYRYEHNNKLIKRTNNTHSTKSQHSDNNVNKPNYIDKCQNQFTIDGNKIMKPTHFKNQSYPTISHSSNNLHNPIVILIKLGII